LHDRSECQFRLVVRSLKSSYWDVYCSGYTTTTIRETLVSHSYRWQLVKKNIQTIPPVSNLILCNPSSTSQQAHTDPKEIHLCNNHCPSSNNPTHSTSKPPSQTTQLQPHPHPASLHNPCRNRHAKPLKLGQVQHPRRPRMQQPALRRRHGNRNAKVRVLLPASTSRCCCRHSLRSR
jgi:hypothetical protein